MSADYSRFVGQFVAELNGAHDRFEQQIAGLERRVAELETGRAQENKVVAVDQPVVTVSPQNAAPNVAVDSSNPVVRDAVPALSQPAKNKK